MAHELAGQIPLRLEALENRLRELIEEAAAAEVQEEREAAHAALSSRVEA